MATTPNYLWPTPDNTDLVRDGAEAIRDLGNAIDTTVEEIDQATTKGDLLVYDGTDYQRLAVGANDTVLLADSVEATGVKWDVVDASALTLLASGTFSANLTRVTGLPATFRALWVEFDQVKSTLSNQMIRTRFNNDPSGTSYSINENNEGGTGISANTSRGYALNTNTTNTGRGCSGQMLVVNYNDNNIFPTFSANTVSGQSTNAFTLAYGRYRNSTSAINEITFFNAFSPGTFSGGNYRVYGLK